MHAVILLFNRTARKFLPFSHTLAYIVHLFAHFDQISNDSLQKFPSFDPISHDALQNFPSFDPSRDGKPLHFRQPNSPMSGNLHFCKSRPVP